MDRPATPAHIAAFVLLLAARVHVIAWCATPVPFWDEWGDLEHILLPWSTGTLHAADLFVPNNEHRIVLTRLLDLGLFAIQGGTWRVLTEMLVNQFAFCLGAILLIRHLSADLAAPRAWALLVGSVALLAIPFDWQAQTWGFLSQIYACALLSVLALLLLGSHGPARLGFWIGIACALAGTIVFAGASAALLASIALIAARDLRGPAPRRALAAAALLATALALLLATTPFVPVNAALHAHSVRQFLAAWLRVLAWPLPSGGVLLTWAPVLVFLGNRLRTGREADPVFWTNAALALWGALIAAALADARAGAPLESRYTVFLLPGLLLNLAVLLRLFANPRTLAGALLLCWPMAIGVGAAARLPEITHAMAERRLNDELQQRNVAAYVRTGDIAVLRKPGFNIPHPDPDTLARLLRQGEAAHIFPALREADLSNAQRWRKAMAKAATDAAIAAIGMLLFSFARPFWSAQRPRSKGSWRFNG